ARLTVDHLNASTYSWSLRQFHQRLFKLLQRRGKPDAARAVCGELLAPYEQAAVSSPGDVESQLRLADALYWGSVLAKDTGRAEEAHKLGDRALGLYGKLPTALPPPAQVFLCVSRYYFKFNLLLERKCWAEAAAACRKAIEFEPKSVWPYYTLAKMLIDEKKFD